MGEQSDTAELPVDLDIEVEAMALDENELEQLRQDTRCVFVYDGRRRIHMHEQPSVDNEMTLDK